MSVPDKVPANVPGAAAAPAKRKRARNDDSVAHLTRAGDGWRFQLRVPAALAEDFRLAGVAPPASRTRAKVPVNWGKGRNRDRVPPSLTQLAILSDKR